MLELNRLSASQQARLIREKSISCTELLEVYLAEIEAHDRDVNAFVTLDIEGAREQARRLDKLAASDQFLGSLHGLPVGIKDLSPVANMRCTFGSIAYENNIAERDATHVTNLREAGANIIGKTNTPEFGHGRFGGQTDNLVSGLTRNPLDLRKTVSSSSGGSAAALAGCFVALADGSDIAGSIRGPAAWCGLYGLRPTSGIVPVWPSASPFNGTNVIGPMSRTITDLSIFFDALRGPGVAPLHDTPDPIDEGAWKLENLRIGWCLTPDGANTASEIGEALEPLRKILVDAGAVVQEAEPDFAGLHSAQALLRNFGVVVKLGKEIAARPQCFSDELQLAVAKGEALSNQELVNALRVCDRAYHNVCTFFGSFDLMIWPTSTQRPFAADARSDDIREDWKPIELTPVLQLPALALPVAKTPDGMPCGVQLIGPKRSDLGLIHLAKQLEPLIGYVDPTV